MNNIMKNNKNYKINKILIYKLINKILYQDLKNYQMILKTVLCLSKIPINYILYFIYGKH